MCRIGGGADRLGGGLAIPELAAIGLALAEGFAAIHLPPNESGDLVGVCVVVVFNSCPQGHFTL